MKYADYLKSSYWLDFKQKWYSIEKNKCCTICGSSKQLNVHHKRYKYKKRSILGKEIINSECFPKEDVISLCRECHSMLHKFKISTYLGVIKIEIIKYLLSIGYKKEEAFVYQKTNKEEYRNLSKKFALQRHYKNLT